MKRKTKRLGAFVVGHALTIFATSYPAETFAQAPVKPVKAANAGSAIPLEIVPGTGSETVRTSTTQQEPSAFPAPAPPAISSLQNPFVPALSQARNGVRPSPQSAAAGDPRRRAAMATPQGSVTSVKGLRNPYVWSSGGYGGQAEPNSLLGLWRKHKAESEIIVGPESLATTTPLASPQSSPQTQTGVGGGAYAAPIAPGYGANAPGLPTLPSTNPAMPGATAPGMPGANAPIPEANAGTNPAAPTTPSPTTPADTTPGAAPNTAAADAIAAATAAGAGDEGPGFGGGLSAAQDAVPMIGDMSPYRLHSPFSAITASATTPNAPAAPPGLPSVNPPSPPSARASQAFYPTIRVFKISENMSPRPQDRFFFNMNTYWQVNQDINRKFEVPVKNINAYRYFFGFEKTFNDGKGSFGARFPIDNLSGTPTASGVKTPGSTSLGNLSVFGKYVLEENKKTGSLISVGLAITPPTGPAKFAGAPWIFGINSVSIQPFMGYIWNRGNFYAHGFSAFDFTVNVNDVSLMYNDFGIGYYLIRSNDADRFLTALVPTFEVHVNTPLNHRDWYKPSDLTGTADVVNLTYGFNFEFKKSAILSTALITPVSSPRPFTAELAVLLNIYYGRSRASRVQITPPPVF